MRDRVILHSDLNNFYASVECRDDPSLKDKPVAVVGDPQLRHGIILAKNELAKKFGVRTGQVIWEARAVCPELITIKGNFDKYIRASEEVREIYESFTDRVESFGIDECWLDVSGIDGKIAADCIRDEIKSKVGITASVGVSWNKVYAKLASDLKKPNATTVINRENYQRILYGLPCEYLLNVGKATKAQLDKYNIKTIGDISLCDVKFLKRKFGKWGEYLWVYATGQDNSVVAQASDSVIVKSVGNSSTAPKDLQSASEVLIMVTALAESVAARLRRKGLKGDVIHLDVVDNQFSHFAKQVKITIPTNTSGTIAQIAMGVFSNEYKFRLPIRSIGVRVSGIVLASAPMQISFFDNELKHCGIMEEGLAQKGSELAIEQNARSERLEKTLDQILKKHGQVMRATHIADKKLPYNALEICNIGEVSPLSLLKGSS